jgi:hypothetical protein
MRWRVVGGTWSDLPADLPTTDAMPIQTWNGLAWMRFGVAELNSGMVRIEVKLPDLNALRWFACQMPGDCNVQRPDFAFHHRFLARCLVTVPVVAGCSLLLDLQRINSVASVFVRAAGSEPELRGRYGFAEDLNHPVFDRPWPTGYRLRPHHLPRPMSTRPLPALLPRPRHLQRTSGSLAGRPTTLRVDPAGAELPAVHSWCSEIGLLLAVDPTLGRYTAAAGDAPDCTPPIRAEGYALRVDRNGLAIRGSDARGLGWGLATLAQLLSPPSSPPCLVIADWPEYGIRYHHDDVSRRQVSTLADFKRIIRRLAAFKISHYTLYLEDMVQVEALRGLGAGRGAFTPDDLHALVAEGERWQVEVFPTLSLAGHQENLLRLPRFRSLAAPTWQPPSSFDPRNPEVRRHLAAVLDAVVPLFPSPYFHMGFDEIQGMDADGFTEHLNWCAAELVRRGKTPLFWADMLYNHFGCNLLERLHPAAIPVAWGYGADGGEARAALPELLRHRSHAWILGGYNSWASFLHAPLPELIRQWQGWRAAADPGRIAAFGAAQWGDQGYENHRDLCWALFAACAEQGWSGDDAEAESVEARFQGVFHGHPLPELTRLRRLLAGDLSLSPGQAWRLHRLPAPGWVRLAHAGKLPSPARLAADGRRLEQARRLLARARGAARQERGQLRHYQVAIDRLTSVVARAGAAHATELLRPALAALATARRSYRSAWLAHNRSESLDVSLAVFDQQADSWRTFGRSAARRRSGWIPLDLASGWDAFSADIAGLPIGIADLAGVPFRFAPIGQTHAEITPGATLRLMLPNVPIRDLHLVATLPRDGDQPRPGARLRLLFRECVMFEEELLSIRHLCDWWAPLGEHLWAGGGLAYVDPLRVRYVLCPNPPFGLTCIHRFPWPVAPVADRLELTCLAGRPLQVFALTVEEARR